MNGEKDLLLLVVVENPNEVEDLVDQDPQVHLLYHHLSLLLQGIKDHLDGNPRPLTEGDVPQNHLGVALHRPHRLFHPLCPDRHHLHALDMEVRHDAAPLPQDHRLHDEGILARAPLHHGHIIAHHHHNLEDDDAHLLLYLEDVHLHHQTILEDTLVPLHQADGVLAAHPVEGIDLHHEVRLHIGIVVDLLTPVVHPLLEDVPLSHRDPGIVLPRLQKSVIGSLLPAETDHELFSLLQRVLDTQVDVPRLRGIQVHLRALVRPQGRELEVLKRWKHRLLQEMSKMIVGPPPPTPIQMTIPMIANWRKDSITPELDAEIERMRQLRLNAIAEHHNIAFSVRRALYELELAEFDLRASEARLAVAEKQSELASKGILTFTDE
ncbi:hypothetical protein FS842_001264 [Serendipita sp. 407]|nr:hypothetical protein FS842_001264 [Serendipita sp. 407]